MPHRVPIRQVSQYLARPLQVPRIWSTFKEPAAAFAPWRYPIAPKTLSTLDLLGVSPIAAGIAQLLTYCLAAVLWAVAIADWLTADQRRQVQLLRIAGHSQASIGRRLGLTPYHVRKLLK
jgi:hypothetical protein